MTFNFGLNTGLGFGTGFNGFNAGYQTGSIDYAKLNAYTNSIMNQFNAMSYSPLNTFAVQSSMPGWLNNISSCFNFNTANTNAMSLPSFLGCQFSTNVNGGCQTKLVEGYEEKKAEEKKKAEEDKKKSEETKAKSEQAKKQADEICEKLYVAMKGAGTDDAAVDAALAEITEDNVLEVMETYIQQYSEDMDGETLIESLQNEYWVGWSGKLTKITNGLKDKLAKRAEKMGLNAEAKSFRAKVTSENNSWWNIDDEVINNHFNTLLAAMITKRDQG